MMSKKLLLTLLVVGGVVLLYGAWRGWLTGNDKPPAIENTRQGR